MNDLMWTRREWFDDSKEEWDDLFYLVCIMVDKFYNELILEMLFLSLKYHTDGIGVNFQVCLVEEIWLS